MLNKKYIESLRSIYSEMNSLSVFFIEGDYGIGKSTIIKQFLKDKTNVVRIENIQYQKDIPHAIVSAIKNYLFLNNISLEMDDYDEQSAKQYLLSLCDRDIIIYFDDITQEKYQGYYMYIKDLISTMQSNNSNHKILILVEISTDKLDLFKNDYLDLRNDIHYQNKIIKKAQTIETGKNDLIQFFKEKIGNSVVIKEKVIEEILEGCFYNPLYLSRFSIYMRDEGLIKNFDGHEYCDRIDKNELAEFVENQVMQRYKKLEKKLQTTIQNAAITGYNIDTNLLINPIKLLEVENHLDRIERKTHLINNLGTQYYFETEEVHYIIEKMMSNEESRHLHNLIGDFLVKNISNKDRDDYERIAYHFEKSDNFQNAAIYLFKEMIACYHEQNYHYVVSLCNKLEKYFVIDALSSIHYQVIIYYKMLSQKYLSMYDEALITINTLLEHNSIFDYKMLQYQLGYILYNVGQTNEAKKILSQLRKEVKDDYLKIKIDNILSGIYDQLGDRKNSIRIFNEAILLSESTHNQTMLYVLYRNFNMLNLSEETMPKMLEAYIYFHKENNILEEAKAAHNIGMQYIDDFDLVNANKYIDISIKLMKTHLTKDICFPYAAKGNCYLFIREYYAAIESYQKALLHAFDDFIRVVIYLNLAECYRNIGNSKEMYRYIILARHLINNNKEEDMYVQKRNFNIILALYCYQSQNYLSASQYMLRAYKYETEYMNYTFYGLLLMKWHLQFLELSNKEIPSEYKKYSHRKLIQSTEYLYNNHFFAANLLFWGS